MTLDPRTPVLVGAGQLVQRPDDLDGALEAIECMAVALERAADDAGARSLLGAATAVRVVRGAWPYSDPGRLLAARFGADAVTGITANGGNTPQSLVNRSASEIAAGTHDVVLLVGAETIWTRRRIKRQGKEYIYTEQSGVEPDETLGVEVAMSSQVEAARGFELPVNFYPTFDSAIRARRAETIDEHRDRLSQLWEGFNAVAVRNPYAWNRTPMTAAEIREPGPSNRMVGFPYTKAMNSNWDLDQAAAVILCSVEAAERHGVSRDRWVFPLAGTDGRDTDLVSNRWDLAESPAIRTAGRRALELAGVGPDDLAHVDLYSCFPSAVQIGARELGLDENRQLTVTGGLTFAGGPLNNYVMHSIATMAGLLRDQPDSVGLCSANGGFVTKHAFGLYSTEPPASGFRHENCQEAIDAHPSRELAADHTGAVTIEAYTVMHGPDGPERGLFACLLDDGRRQWANTTDMALMKAVMASEHIGTRAEVTPEFALEVT
jgi:acetyl-CoA C-acetyltransferase